MSYVCGDCVKEHELPIGMASATAPCEICGPVLGDWEPKFVVWETELTRFGKPVADQLKDRDAPKR